VVGGEMPPPANEADCKLLWARSNPGKTVDATSEIVEKVRRYANAKATEKAAKEMAAGFMSDICAAMGDGEVLAGPDGKPLVTWKSAKDSAKTDWEGLARWMYAQGHDSTALPPEYVAKFTEAKPGSRRFLVKEANLPAAAVDEAADSSHGARAA
jgi:hypothetical protein